MWTQSRTKKTEDAAVKSKVTTLQSAPGREQLARQLHSLGLTEYESRSLLALLERNPATAYEVAKNAALPRANVYSALEGLAKKGAVQLVNENPARYVPVDPAVFLSRLAAQTNDLCRELAESLTAITPQRDAEYVWSLPSLDHVRAKMRELIEQAEKHVWLKGNIRHLRECMSSLKTAGERGVSIVIVLFGSTADQQELEMLENIRVHLHEGSGTAVGMSEHLVSMTTDFGSALTANLNIGGYGVYTQNIPVVVIVESLIRHEIYMAEIFKHFGPEIEQRFGPSLMTLRKELLPSDQFNALTLSVRESNSDKGEPR
jgi:sugar-specific transcriptional regulator TrmB